MKKSVLILLTFVPILAGYLVNRALWLPGIGSIVFSVVPFLVLAFWFYLGGQYAKTNWNAVTSVLIGSATGILSLALYLWQFLGESDETRNMALAVLSQMYTVAAPSYLVGRLAILFEAQPNFIGQASMVALQVIGLVLMVVVFTAGYLWGRKRWRKRA